MATSRRTARRGFIGAWRVLLCAVLLAPSGASAADARSLEQCGEHLAVSPRFATDGTAFCAAAVKDTFVLHVTRDHAKTWTATKPTGATLLPGLPPRVYELLISPDFATDRTLVVVLTGFVFYSTDAGATFVQAVGNYGRLSMADALHGISADPSHGVVLSAGRYPTSVTVRSTVLDPALPAPRPLVGTGTPDITFLATPPGSPDIAYAVGESGNTPPTTQHSFYACTATYACPEKLGSFPAGQTFAEAWFAGDFRTSGVLFAATVDIHGRTHLYVSRDRARRFAPVPGLSGYLDQAYRAGLAPMLVPAAGKPGSRTVFARLVGGGSSRKSPTTRLFRSDDNGKTWRLVSWGRSPEGSGPSGTMPYDHVERSWSRLPQGLLTHASDGRLLFSGTNKGIQVVWCSSDAGRTWRPACR